MDPIVNRCFAGCSHSLSDFTFVVWKLEVHSTAVDIKRFSKILCAHYGAFNMPAWKPIAPRGWPSHNVIRRCSLPKGKVNLVSFFILAVEFSSAFHQLLQYT